VFFKEAQFKDGEPSWLNYLAKNINSKIPVKSGAPKGSYQVIIRFIIDKDGLIISSEPETHWGYGMESEARRVIDKSPRWKPLIMLNEPQNAYRRQPVTFVIEEK